MALINLWLFHCRIDSYRQRMGENLELLQQSAPATSRGPFGGYHFSTPKVHWPPARGEVCLVWGGKPVVPHATPASPLSQPSQLVFASHSDHVLLLPQNKEKPKIVHLQGFSMHGEHCITPRLARDCTKQVVAIIVYCWEGQVTKSTRLWHPRYFDHYIEQ